MRIRIKVCGITRLTDAIAAAEIGVDAIGLVFYSQSPRRVRLDVAEQIASRIPPFISVVGLFVDASASFIRDTIGRVPLDHLQFHGDESAAFCDQFGLPYIKAIRVHSEIDWVECSNGYPNVRGLLLDSYKPGIPGGTGTTFEWTRLIGQEISRPIILAGGLNSKNVERAIKVVRPWAVDVSTGVESAPGIKDLTRMSEFVEQVNSVNILGEKSDREC